MASLRIELPLVPAYKPEIEHIDYFESAVLEIIELNNYFHFEIADHPSIKPIITGIKNKSRDYYITIGKEWTSLLVFEAEIPDQPIETYFSTDSKYFDSTEEWISHYQSELIMDICMELFHLTIFSNIAKPGALKVSDGQVFLNGEKHSKTIKGYSILRETLDEINTLNWIKYKNLKIGDVIKWFRNNNFSYTRFSSCSTERALNAFSKLFMKDINNSVFHLLWALVGIETLFCNSKEGISTQIFEKTQVIFGELTSFKKKLKMMYNYRSRLIHGDVDFGPENYETIRDNEEKIQNELFDASILAVAILTGAIQELVLRNEIEFRFQYKLMQGDNLVKQP